MTHDSLRYINILTYLLTYLLTYILSLTVSKLSRTGVKIFDERQSLCVFERYGRATYTVHLRLTGKFERIVIGNQRF